MLLESLGSRLPLYLSNYKVISDHCVCDVVRGGGGFIGL